MATFLKMFRNITYLNYRHKWGTFASIYKTTKSQRWIHQSSKFNVKMYLEQENKFAYDIMINKGYGVFFNLDTRETSLTKEQFDQTMSCNWLELSPTHIFEVFPKLGLYCIENNLCISNKMFDQYIDTLTDNIKNATDEQLTSIFYFLKEWPEPPSIRTRNYIEVWAALDDECYKRLLGWSSDKMLSYLALFFMLNVTKYSDFSYKCLQKFASKAKQLTPAQVVQTMFYIGIIRKPPYDMHNLEVRIENCFTEFNVDELGILSMGFFKSRTPIRNIKLVSRIMNKITENSKDIHEVTLAALLKVIRYSMKFTSDDRIYDLLDVIKNETPRVSVMCNVQIALIGTATLTFHKECLNNIANVINNNIAKARLKDLERLVLSFGIFNFIPETKVCFFTTVMNELRKAERDVEINKYRRSFISCIGYLGLLQFYPVDLINRALCPEFLEEAYGKQVYGYGNEVLVLNNVAKIFCKDLKVNFLSDRDVNIIAKRYTAYIPSEEYSKQYNITEKMFLDVINILKESRGGSNYVTGNHILSHHQRGDIIMCNDHHDRPLPVHDKFSKKLFGLVYPPPDENKWIVLVIAGRNVMIYKHNMPTGHYQSKVRELQAIGYRPALVLWSVYSQCQSQEEKLNYINSLIADVSK